MKTMMASETITALGGLVVLAASSIAGTTIWALLTAPTAVADTLNGLNGQPLRFVAQVMSDVVLGVIRYF